jgi:hypothetical protein
VRQAGDLLKMVHVLLSSNNSLAASPDRFKLSCGLIRIVQKYGIAYDHGGPPRLEIPELRSNALRDVEHLKGGNATP